MKAVAIFVAALTVTVAINHSWVAANQVHMFGLVYFVFVFAFHLFSTKCFHFSVTNASPNAKLNCDLCFIKLVI